MVDLKEEKFSMVDSQMRYQLLGNKLYIEIDIPTNLKDVASDDNLSTSGKKMSTGYPDIEFIDENSQISYLECKTYNIKSKSTSFRSFYLSPSESFKVTNKAHHFAASYEIYVSGTRGENKIYKCRAWKILTLENLSIDVKYEFQSDNKRLYSKELVLAEGKFEES